MCLLTVPCASWAGSYGSKVLPLNAAIPVYQRPPCLANESFRKIIISLQDKAKGRPPPGGNRTLTKCSVEAGKTKYRPIIFAIKKVKKKTIKDVQSGLTIGQRVFGVTGPLHLFLVGNNKDKDGPEGIDPDPQAGKLARAYCKSQEQTKSDLGSSGTLVGCIKEMTKEYFNYDCCGAAHNPAVPFSDIRYQSFSYAGANVQSREGSIVKITIHEYIHTYQNNYTVWGNDIAAEDAGLVEAYSPGPVWLEEGAAEYLAQRISYQYAQNDGFIANMQEYLEQA